jgi:hypothetical protein
MKSDKLTPELADQIIGYIRVGTFPNVAAEASGVPRKVFQAWLAQGKKPKAAKHYRDFYRKVQQAQAIARLKAETAMLTDDPKFWLRSGPGREQPDNPGWTAVVRPLLTGDKTTINLFASPDFLAFLATLRQVLAPYPDALAALTQAMDTPNQPVKWLPNDCEGNQPTKEDHP